MPFLPASKIVGGRQPETTSPTPFPSVQIAPLLDSGRCASAAAVRGANRYLSGEPPSGADGEDKIKCQIPRAAGLLYPTMQSNTFHPNILRVLVCQAFQPACSFLYLDILIHNHLSESRLTSNL